MNMTKKIDITDEIITIETARLAKQKNFDVFTRTYYCEYLTTKIDPEYPEGGGAFGWTKGEIEIGDFYIRNNDSGSDTSNKNYIMYARPTQSILQRWLREVKKIDIIIHRLAEGNKTTVGYHASLWYNETNSSDDSCLAKATYEEALEDGLQHALISI
jgi:hypothetical protein